MYFSRYCNFFHWQGENKSYGCVKSLVSLQPSTAIEVLINKSLIRIDDYDFMLIHDQLRDVGRDIV